MIKINQSIVEEILKFHYHPYDDGIRYDSYILDGDHLEITFTDRTGEIIGSFGIRPTQHLKISDINKHPIIIKHSRNKKINSIL